MKALYLNENKQILFCPTNLIKTQLPSPILITKVTYDVLVALFSGLFGSTSLFPLKEKKKMTSEMDQHGNCSDKTCQCFIPCWHWPLLLHLLAAAEANTGLWGTGSFESSDLTFLVTVACTLKTLGKEIPQERLRRGRKFYQVYWTLEHEEKNFPVSLFQNPSLQTEILSYKAQQHQ